MPAADDSTKQETSNPRDFLSSLGGFVGQVAKTPFAALVAVGLLLVIAGLVKNFGGVQFQTQGSQYLAFGTGLGLIVLGLLGPTVAGRRMRKRLEEVTDQSLPAIAADPKFLLKILIEAMPPAFVKELDESEPPPDIIKSNALLGAQQSADQVPRDEVLRRIRLDHLAGDKQTARNGASIQLEFPAAKIRGKLRPILTFKTLITYGGKKYVAGWFVPVEREDLSADDRTLYLRQDTPSQVLFRLSRTTPDDGTEVAVGKAVLASLKGKPLAEPEQPAAAQDPVTATPPRTGP